MSRPSFLLGRSRSISHLLAEKGAVLPISTGPRKSKLRVRALLSHCLYRRVAIWIMMILFVSAFTLFKTRIEPRHVRIQDLVKIGKNQPGRFDGPPMTVPTHLIEGGRGGVLQKQDGDGVDEHRNTEGDRGQKPISDGEIRDGPHWLKYPHMDGYFNGLRSLVSFADYKPERFGSSTPTATEKVHRTDIPTPTVYRPQPDYTSEVYRSEYHEVQPCYLDAEKQVPVPDTYAYNGVPQSQAKAAIGSYDLLGLREDICYDRFSRYGPYGLGYETMEGGTGEGTDTEKSGAETIWQQTGKIDYRPVSWGAAQKRCVADNKKRFLTGDTNVDGELRSKNGVKPIGRIAVVVRTYVGFQWTQHAILNFRAMISELALKSGGEYDIHFLLHVKDDDAPIWADPNTAQRILNENVPLEFHDLCTLWSEAQMRLFYPGYFGDAFENPSNGDIHGVYRSAHMPLQHFALKHPEYVHFWNWEMDMRYTGNYYELFDRLDKWGEKQSRTEMWERSAKYYIPSLHGSWENFTALVHKETEASSHSAILGDVIFAGKNDLKAADKVGGFLPKSCSVGSDMSQCGVGEEADLITLNPLFDADASGWVFAADASGYPREFDKPPRRCAIVTASRLSKRLLEVMHEETWRLHHSMFSEMFPASMALHHGLKAVYAPHPVFLDRAWDSQAIEDNFNGGRDHSSGGHGSPFDLQNEHNHKGTSWYYNSEFAGLLWRRWLGYAQMDGRGKDGGRGGQGTFRGGRDEEANPNGEGRLCLRSMLVHPIKWENPSEKEM